MKKLILSVVAVLFTACQAITCAESPAPPVVAFDILKADIDLLLKNSPPAIDHQIQRGGYGRVQSGRRDHPSRTDQR